MEKRTEVTCQPSQPHWGLSSPTAAQFPISSCPPEAELPHSPPSALPRHVPAPSSPSRPHLACKLHVGTFPTAIKT